MIRIKSIDNYLDLAYSVSRKARSLDSLVTLILLAQRVGSNCVRLTVATDTVEGCHRL